MNNSLNSCQFKNAFELTKEGNLGVAVAIKEDNYRTIQDNPFMSKWVIVCKAAPPGGALAGKSEWLLIRQQEEEGWLKAV